MMPPMNSGNLNGSSEEQKLRKLFRSLSTEDKKSLVDIARQLNDYAARARNNQLSIEEITGATYTLTNVGSFGATMGTPIILQPNVGILAIGAIEKKPFRSLQPQALPKPP